MAAKRVGRTLDERIALAESKRSKLDEEIKRLRSMKLEVEKQEREKRKRSYGEIISDVLALDFDMEPSALRTFLEQRKTVLQKENMQAQNVPEEVSAFH